VTIHIKRNIYILSCCNGFAISANVVIGTVSALVGHIIVADKSLATLPIAVQYFSSMLFTTPASFLMKHIGRRAGFLIGVSFGMLGGLAGFLGILKLSFVWLCVGAFLIGISNAFSFYYRFAVADIAEESYRSRAISYVMAGGVAAALIGTNLANVTRAIIPDALYSGSFLSITGLFLINFILLLFIDIPKPGDWEAHHSGRPLRMIARQPAFLTAVLSGTIGYGLMTFLMAATPLSMQDHAHQFNHISFVIQWHVLGMFAPSFVTGFLIDRFGVRTIIAWGVIGNALCVGINLLGTSLACYWAALFCLGVGWNFIFVGATTLLTEAYEVAERAKTQAVNDFLIFGIVAIATLSSGYLYHFYGWRAINIGAIPWIVLLIVIIRRFR